MWAEWSMRERLRSFSYGDYFPQKSKPQGSCSSFSTGRGDFLVSGRLISCLVPCRGCNALFSGFPARGGHLGIVFTSLGKGFTTSGIVFSRSEIVFATSENRFLSLRTVFPTLRTVFPTLRTVFPSLRTVSASDRVACASGLAAGPYLAGWAFQTLMSSNQPLWPATPSSILDLVAWPMPGDLK